MKVSTPLKTQSLLMAVAIIFQTLYPTAALAVADSPRQSDFQAYEDFNSTDMVNLITGDFTYNIPLLNVPGPGGGYQIPLAYHAGIELNEEASWVGLGWSLNPGVMTRDVSIYPDDFSGERVTNTAYNAGLSGYQTVKSYPFYTSTYDSQKGRGGTIDLLGIVDFGWGTQKHFGIAPLGLTLKDGQISYDMEYMVKGLMSAMVTVGTSGIGSTAMQASVVNMLASGGSALQGLSMANNAATPQGVSYFGNLTMDQQVRHNGLFSQTIDYHWYMDAAVENAQYGTLYLGKLVGRNTDEVKQNVINSANWPAGSPPGNSTLANNVVRSFKASGSPAAALGERPVTDAHIAMAPGVHYGNNINASSLAYDNFDVKAPGIGGVIKPYRLDMGTVVHPYGMDDASGESDVYAGPGFIDPAAYKVQFKYNGDISNSYTFHNMDPQGDLYEQDFPYEIDGTDYDVAAKEMRFLIKDPKAYVNYLASYNNSGVGAYSVNYNANSRIEANRPGLVNKRLIHGRHIEWYSNDEITNNTATANGFINTHQGYDRTTDSKIPDHGIGGFSITNEAGLTYHFSIPVYNKSESLSTLDNSGGSVTTYGVDNDNYYATMWLLTGITGPDFIDRGTTGVIDNQDWGYWVKFDYGKFATQYRWKDPFFSTYASGTTESSKAGTKETYYLDKISTPSHTALFVKSARNDGKSNFLWNVSPYTNAAPSSSLKLDDVYVLVNEDYNKLIAASPAGLGMTINGTGHDNELRNSDTYANVTDNYDVSAGGIQTFLNSNQVQKLHFNYSYQLCNKTYNSFPISAGTNPPTYSSITGYSSTSALTGKLTLTSVELFTKGNARIMPGYVFDYDAGNSAQNPDFDPYKWDGYGIYKSGASSSGTSPRNSEKKGDQWCLRKITTPLGGEIAIEYERDDYSSVNGYPLSQSFLPLKYTGSISGASSVTFDQNYLGTNATLSDYVVVGDQVFCSTLFGGTQSPLVTSISGNVATLASNLPSGSVLLFGVKASKKFGGTVRVKSIKTKDENNNEYETRYFYTKNGLANGTSSGVASFEPEFDRLGGNFAFYSRYDHPYAPILYSNVTVVNGRYDNTFNETARRSFHFVTPDHQFLKMGYQSVHFGPYLLLSASQLSGAWGNFTTVDNTSKIGALDTIKEYNKFNNLTSKTVFSYSDNSTNEFGNYMGHYTENTLLWESINTLNTLTQRNYNMRFLQSYKLKRPNMLKSVTTYKDRSVSTQEIIAYDYLTGQPLKTRTTYGGSEKYENEITPAYTKYSSLASKVISPANKNMMQVPAETFSYVYDKNGSRQPLGATVMTWANSSYPQFNGSSGLYQSQSPPGGSAPYPNTVLLPYRTYAWKSEVEENGVIKNNTFTPYNWSSGPNTNWVRTSQTNLYDQYSHALEVEDVFTGSMFVPQKVSSVKMGYNNAYLVAACANARYTAWCYSGAEDKSSDAGYYSGEVLGSDYQHQSATYAHTGSYCSRMAPWETGFSYRINKADLSNLTQPLKGKYRASIWIHQNGVQGAYMACRGYDAGNNPVYLAGTCFYGMGYTNSNSAGTVEQAGSWYQFNSDVDLAAIPANVSYLVFSVQNGGATGYVPYVYADDFRVYPLANPITSRVIDPKTGQVLASLNVDNYATRFEYDNSGKLKNVYKETKMGFKRVLENKYNFSR